MNPKAAIEFAKWLAKEQPELFEAIYRKATQATLSGFGDFFSSIGSGLSSAASAVGSYLTSPAGMETITQLGSVYLQTKAAKEATQINLERARAGMQPAPIQTVFNPATQTYEAVLNQGTQAQPQYQPITPTIRKTLVAGIPDWAWPVGLAALAFILVFAFNRRR